MKNYGQHLAQQVSIGFSIDPAYGVEPVVHQKPMEFPGKIIIQEAKAAIWEAKNDTSCLALWSDGSKVESGGAGIAFVWKNPAFYRWEVCKTTLGENKEVLDAELWGISQALKIALKETTPKKVGRITVYSDAQMAIKQLQEAKSNAGQALRIQIYKQARQLRAYGGEVIVRWIPGHSGVEGNERADKAAKEASADSRAQVARWSSLTHVKKKITDAKNSEICSWHQSRNEERERRSQSFYVPRLKIGIHPVLGQAPKRYASRFFQLKVGHGAVGVFLERIGVTETAECWWCRRPEQSVHHLYTKCRRWRRERRILRKELQALGIGWQCRPEKRWVANLLGNEQAVQPLLKYLMTTEVGGREGGAERAVEWEQRTDREGEELLDSG